MGVFSVPPCAFGQRSSGNFGGCLWEVFQASMTFTAVPSAGWSSASPAWLCQAAAEPELFPKIEIKNAFIDFFK